MLQVLFSILVLCYCTQSLELRLDSFDIPNMLPLKLKKVPIRNDQGLHLILRNVEVYGLENTRMTYSKLDFFNTQFTCTLINPQINILGHYEMNGIIAESYVYGSGRVNITLNNGKYFHNVNFDVDDQEFARNISVRLFYTTAYNRYYFSGLTVGYESDEFRTNAFMNYHWKEVSRNFLPGASIAMGDFIGSIYKKFDDRLPLPASFLP